MVARGSGSNSFQGFKAFASRKPPSFNNLYWVRFRGEPEILKKFGGASFAAYFTGDNSDTLGGSFGGPATDQARMLSYYANDVTIPSRQITTGDAKTVGAMYRYPTGTTFSEISINFTVPRSLETRMFFERWMNYMAEDSGNRVSWYNESVCPFMDIMKYERGGIIPPSDKVSSTIDPRNRETVKWNQVTGAWVLSNVFPFNISNVQLSNGPAATVSMEVSFYYERYRFYQPNNIGVSEIVDSRGTDVAYTNRQQSPVTDQTATSNGTTAAPVASASGTGKLR
jgi:hypothetical protein